MSFFLDWNCNEALIQTWELIFDDFEIFLRIQFLDQIRPSGVFIICQLNQTEGANLAKIDTFCSRCSWLEIPVTAFNCSFLLFEEKTITETRTTTVSAISLGWLADFGKTLSIIQKPSLVANTSSVNCYFKTKQPDQRTDFHCPSV